MTELVNRKSSNVQSGFTLVELLVVVLILAILMSVALPLYLSAVGDSQRKTCRTNLQTIANVVQATRVKDHLNDYTSLYTTNVKTDITKYPDLKTTPVCPNSGIYSITAGTKAGNFKVVCTTSPDFGHGSYEPGVDNN